MRGAVMQAEDLRRALTGFAARVLEEGAVESVLVPSRGPENSYSWILASRPEALKNAEPLPPVMSVQGARALASITPSPAGGRVLAVMRPCEARASMEMAKLQQLDLSNVVLMTMDCPGVVPLSSYRRDPDSAPDPGNPDTLRPLCGQCTGFTASGDLCMVRTGSDIALAALSEKAESLFRTMGMEARRELSEWLAWKEDLLGERKLRDEASRLAVREEVKGLSGLTRFFSGCVSCRSCRTVCPVCYCRLCFIDMKDRRSPASEHLERSRRAGAARLVSDTLLFHIGRMSHMSLSCVSCGMCQDACPADIPVGTLFSMVSRETASLFDYSPGRDSEEPLPMNTFRLEELHEYED